MTSGSQRRRLISLVTVAPVWSLIGLSGCATDPRASTARVYAAVPKFSGAADDAAAPPEGWRPYILRPDRVKTAYSIARRDGRVALHAVADSAASGLSCATDIDPQRTPWLRWKR